MSLFEIFTDSILGYTESKFDKEFNNLPDYIKANADTITHFGDFDSQNSSDNVSFHLINGMIISPYTSYAWIDHIDLDDKTIELEDIDTFDELKTVKDLLYPWTIKNYSVIYHDLIESCDYDDLPEEEREKKDILERILELPIETIKQFIKDYESTRTDKSSC